MLLHKVKVNWFVFKILYLIQILHNVSIHIDFVKIVFLNGNDLIYIKLGLLPFIFFILLMIYKD